VLPVAVALAAMLAAGADSASAASVYSGKSKDGRARVRLTVYETKAKARITLSPRTVHRVAERVIRLGCGQGADGRDVFVKINWPRTKRTLEVGVTRAFDRVDRCRITRHGKLVARMRMRAR
jgi:hypothetical protein